MRLKIIIMVFLLGLCFAVKIDAQVTKVNGASGNVQINLSLNGNNLSLTGGNIVTMPYGMGDITAILGVGEISANQSTGNITLSADVAGNKWNANKIMGKSVSFPGALSSGQVLKYNGTGWVPSSDNGSAGGSPVWQSSVPNIYFSNGNVGIGTTAQPGIKLAVKGKIHARELIVNLNIPGPDYVFEKDYALAGLPEVESFIRQNKHLPGVPSAKHIEKNKLSLSEMNMVILKKVEELSLYIIDHEDRISKLEERK